MNVMEAKQKISELAQGFQHSVVLLTAISTGVFDALGDKMLSAKTLAEAMNLDARALETLLLALTAEGILEAADGAFRIADAFAPLVLKNGAQTQASILRHNYSMMRSWVQLDDVLRTGEPVRRTQEPRSPEDLHNFICGMANISRLSSQEVAEKLDLSNCRRMLDVGGGPATSSITLAQRYPQLRSVVMDLKDVVAIADEEIRAAGLTDRIETQVGDLHTDEFGDGFDLVYVSNIIHMLGEEETRMVFEKSARALASGGLIVVKDFFLEDSKTAPLFGALFAINMLVGTDRGRSYTWTETEAMLAEAGFGDFQRRPVAMASGLLTGRKMAPEATAGS